MSTASLEPLRPAPEWVHVGGAGYHDRTTDVVANHPPRAYEAGFEAGAFALGKRVYEMFANGQSAEALQLLHSYNSGNAHPVKGWTYEPKRR